MKTFTKYFAYDIILCNMGANIDNQMNDSYQEMSITQVVLSTALATLKFLVIFIPLMLTILCFLFPLQSMYLYMQFGNYQKALDFSVVEMERMDKQGTEYAELVANAVNLSSYIFDDDLADGEYAELCAQQLYDYSTMYLELDDSVRLSVSQDIDDYNISQSSNVVHPSVYNYEGYVNAKQVKADYYLDMTQSVETYTAYFETGSADIDTDILQLMRLNSYFDCEYKQLGINIYDEVAISSDAFYGLDDQVISSFADSVVSTTEKLASLTSIDYLQALYVLSISVENMYYVSENIDDISSSTVYECEAATYMNINNENIKIKDYYASILTIYAS